MFDKFLSKVGVGAAKVDTILQETSVVRGGHLLGEIHMTGGKVNQDVKRVYLELYTHYTYENEEGHRVTNTCVLHALDIDESFSLLANEEVVYDFELEVPFETPVSLGKTKVYLKTGLDVDWAFDPKDKDEIEVLPEPATEAILTTIEELGFEHSNESGTCIEMENPVGIPFVQNFTLIGREGLGSEIEALDLLILANEHQAEVQAEIDKRERGFGNRANHDRVQLNFSLAHDADFDADTLASILRQAL